MILLRSTGRLPVGTGGKYTCYFGIRIFPHSTLYRHRVTSDYQSVLRGKVKRTWSQVLLVFIGLPHCLMAGPPQQLPLARSIQDHSQHEGHIGHDTSVPDPDTDPQKLLADKKESEFNHHLAGFF